MPLPEAVTRKAAEAAALIKGTTAAPAEPAPDKGTPSTDDGKTRAQLEASQAEVRRLTTANARLQEKYNAEVPRYAEEIRDLKGKVKSLEEGRTRKPDEPILTEDERRLIGEDVVPIVEKIVQRVAGDLVTTQMKPLNDRVDTFQRMTDAAYEATLDSQVPNWFHQNDDPKFIAWLQEIDPTTQRLRDDSLQRAHAARQGYVVADIFLAFREGREIGGRLPASPGNLNYDHGPGGGNPPSSNEPGKKVWTRGEIAKFYRDRRSGVYRGKEKESAELERDIIAAQNEGRIQG